MTMTSHIRKKHNKKVKNVKNQEKAAYIQYLLKTKGLSQSLIANELGITESAVSRALYDQSKITRVDEWLEANLGIDI